MRRHPGQTKAEAVSAKPRITLSAGCHVQDISSSRQVPEAECLLAVSPTQNLRRAVPNHRATFRLPSQTFERGMMKWQSEANHPQSVPEPS